MNKAKFGFPLEKIRAMMFYIARYYYTPAWIFIRIGKRSIRALPESIAAGDSCDSPLTPFVQYLLSVSLRDVLPYSADQSVLLSGGWGGDDGGFRGRGLCWWSLLLMRACWPIFVWMTPEKRRWWGKFIRRWLYKAKVRLAAIFLHR